MRTLYDEWLELLVGLEAEKMPTHDIESMRVGFYAGARAIRTLEGNAVRAVNNGLISEDEADMAIDYWGAEIDVEDLDTDLEIH